MDILKIDDSPTAEEIEKVQAHLKKARKINVPMLAAGIVTKGVLRAILMALQVNIILIGGIPSLVGGFVAAFGCTRKQARVHIGILAFLAVLSAFLMRGQAVLPYTVLSLGSLVVGWSIAELFGLVTK